MADTQLPRRRALNQLGLAKSTYYRWLRSQAEGRLHDKKGGSPTPWNKLRPDEKLRILSRARASPELSPRQLALSIVDSEGVYVSESTVFRILKREGLIKPAEIVGFKVGKEYHRKTNKPNELWATDCAHIKVVDWGWYYLVTVDLPPIVIGFICKDVALGMLAPLALSAKQLVVGSVVLAMFFPCIATFVVLLGEPGIMNMLKSAGIMISAALITGGLLNLVL